MFWITVLVITAPTTVVTAAGVLASKVIVEAVGRAATLATKSAPPAPAPTMVTESPITNLPEAEKPVTSLEPDSMLATPTTGTISTAPLLAKAWKLVDRVCTLALFRYTLIEATSVTWPGF